MSQTQSSYQELGLAILAAMSSDTHVPRRLLVTNTRRSRLDCTVDDRAPFGEPTHAETSRCLYLAKDPTGGEAKILRETSNRESNYTLPPVPQDSLHTWDDVPFVWMEGSSASTNTIF